MNITNFNNEEILCIQGLGEFLDQTLNICFSNTNEFIENLHTEDDRSYNTETIIPRIKID